MRHPFPLFSVGAPLLGVLLCVTATTANASAARDPLGDWTGMLVTEQGSCPDERESTLEIRSDGMYFSPGTGTLVLRGVPDRKGRRYHAQLMRQDAKGKPFPMVFEGHPEGDAVVGTYGTPSCRAHITLTRPKTPDWTPESEGK